MSKKKKILFIANIRPNPSSLENSLVRDFEENNISVDFIYAKSPDIFENRFSLFGRIESRVSEYIKYQDKSLSKQIYEKNLDDYLFVFVLKGRYLNEKTLRYIKQKNKKIVCYNPDNPYSNNSGSSNKNIKDTLSLYDMYFMWSKELCKKIETNENIKSVYLPFAADLSLHNSKFYKKEDSNKKYKVSFIGNWDKERESWLEKINDKENLVLFGNNWGYSLHSADLKKCYTGRQVMTNEFIQTVKESIININILRLQNKNSNNMRTFEIPASGGFLLHEYSEEVAEMFIEGEEIEFFRDKEELNQKIDYYLKNPHKAETIAKNAYQKIISSQYTYTNRIKTVIKEVEKFL